MPLLSISALIFLLDAMCISWRHDFVGTHPETASHSHAVDMANSQASGEKPKDKEGLGAGLILDVILDRIGNEELDLEEDLHGLTKLNEQGDIIS